MLEKLRTGLELLNLQLEAKQQQSLLEYLNLLSNWNKVHNLTAICNKEDMVANHLLDSLSILKLIAVSNSPILDLGSGAGLPGVPLSICLPQQKFCLLDSNIKKIIFLRKIIAELKLENVTLEHNRAEQFKPTKLFSYIVVRACANIDMLVKLAAPLLAKNGTILAMKGPNVENELDNLQSNLIAKITTLEVPFVEKKRFVATITRKTL